MVMEKLDNNVNSVTLCPVNAQDEYYLGLVYNVTENSVAYSFDKFTDMLFIKKN